MTTNSKTRLINYVLRTSTSRLSINQKLSLFSDDTYVCATRESISNPKGKFGLEIFVKSTVWSSKGWSMKTVPECLSLWASLRSGLAYSQWFDRVQVDASRSKPPAATNLKAKCKPKHIFADRNVSSLQNITVRNVLPSRFREIMFKIPSRNKKEC